MSVYNHLLECALFFGLFVGLITYLNLCVALFYLLCVFIIDFHNNMMLLLVFIFSVHHAYIYERDDTKINVTPYLRLDNFFNSVWSNCI